MVDNPPVKRPANSVREPTNFVVASPSGATLEFTYPPQKPMGEYSQVPVRVDLEKMLEDITLEGRTGGKAAPSPLWKLVPFANSSHQAQDSQRSYDNIRTAIKGGQLDMPEVSLAGVDQGNHRLLELKRQGFKEIYVLAPPGQAAAMEEKYGTGPKKYAKAAEVQETPAEPETREGPSAVDKYINRGSPEERGSGRGM
jgi:hypothetical protein